MSREKIATLGIVREKGFLYYIRADGVWRSQMSCGSYHSRGTAERVKPYALERERNFMYFLDADGDITRVARTQGGTKKHR